MILHCSRSRRRLLTMLRHSMVLKSLGYYQAITRRGTSAKSPQLFHLSQDIRDHRFDITIFRDEKGPRSRPIRPKLEMSIDQSIICVWDNKSFKDGQSDPRNIPARCRYIGRDTNEVKFNEVLLLYDKQGSDFRRILQKVEPTTSSNKNLYITFRADGWQIMVKNHPNSRIGRFAHTKIFAHSTFCSPQETAILQRR